MGDHCHNHRHFHACTVHAQLCLGICLITQDQREDDFVGCLIEDSCHTQHQDGPRVTEHTLQQSKVKVPLHLEEIGDEEEGDEPRTPKVDAEDIIDLSLAQHHKIEDVQGNVEEDKQQFQRGKLEGPLLESQVTEWHRLNGVEHHNRCHHEQIVGVVGIAQAFADGGEETEHESQKDYRQRTHHSCCRGEHRVGLLILLVGKTEQRGFHTKRQEDQHQCRVGIDVHAHTIIARLLGHVVGVERHKQVIEKPAHYAAQAIDDCIFCKAFEIGHFINYI